MVVYIGNISDRTTSEKLINLFSPYGEVASAQVVAVSSDSNERFALVTMHSHRAVLTAIDALHGTYFLGNNIVVKEHSPVTTASNDAGTYVSQNGGYIRRF